MDLREALLEVTCLNADPDSVHFETWAKAADDFVVGWNESYSDVDDDHLENYGAQEEWIGSQERRVNEAKMKDIVLDFLCRQTQFQIVEGDVVKACFELKKVEV